MGLFSIDSTVSDGYNLLYPMAYFDTYLVDNCGREIRSWTSAYRCRTVAYLREDGSLLRAGNAGGINLNGGGAGGILEIFDWNGNQTWELTFSDSLRRQHHDLEPLPNGNFLFFAWEKKTKAEAAAMGRDTSNLTLYFWSEMIAEIEPVGNDSANIVWEWHSWDHLVQDFDSTKSNFDTVANLPELININAHDDIPAGSSDWLHFNSIDYHPGFDQVLVSVHGFSEIWVIDHSTTTLEAASHSGGNSGKGGDILYRWGNPQHYDQGDSSDQVLFEQHDARWIADTLIFGGKIMVFNNGLGRPGGNYSSVDVITPPVDSSGNYQLFPSLPYGPAGLDYTYDGGASQWFSLNISGAEPLPNDHILICDGPDGRSFEIDTSGNIHWEYVNPVNFNGPSTQGGSPGNNQQFRIERYPVSYPAFTGKTLTPGNRLEINPDPLPAECMPVSGESILISNFMFEASPNPFSDFLLIRSGDGNAISLELTDVLGRMVWNADLISTESRIETSALQPGIYHLSVAGYFRQSIRLVKY